MKIFYECRLLQALALYELNYTEKLNNQSSWLIKKLKARTYKSNTIQQVETMETTLDRR